MLALGSWPNATDDNKFLDETIPTALSIPDPIFPAKLGRFVCHDNRFMALNNDI